MNGERSVVAMPLRSPNAGRRTGRPRRRVRWGALAAAAALFFAILYVGRDAIDGMMAPGGPRATVVSAEGLYRLPAGSLEAGTAIGDHESIRTGPGAHAVLRLADGSTVNVNERTELFVTAAWSGQAIHLQRGDIIVKAAKQRRGHLRVLTRDSIASVKGTIFAVSAGMGGSVVSVVEGSVEVNQPGREVLLSPGQQAASMPALTTSVAQASPGALRRPYYLELLGSLAKIERELASFAADLRTKSSMLPYLPAGAIVYGTIPNPGRDDRPGVVTRRRSVGAERHVRRLVEFRNRSVAETDDGSPPVGEPAARRRDRVQCQIPGTDGPMPIVMARVQSGMRAPLTSALEGLFAATGESPAAYSVSDELMVVSNSSSHLAWVLGHLSQGAGSPFAAAIGERYRARRWVADCDRRAAGGRDGRRGRCPADCACRHDRDEVPVPRTAGACGRGGKRSHVRVQRRANRNGLVARRRGIGRRGGVSAGRCARRRLRIDT